MSDSVPFSFLLSALGVLRALHVSPDLFLPEAESVKLR